MSIEAMTATANGKSNYCTCIVDTRYSLITILVEDAFYKLLS